MTFLRHPFPRLVSSTQPPAAIQRSGRARVWCLCLVGALSILSGGGPSSAQEPADGESAPSPEQVQFFESKVRPLLIEHCGKCHGAEKPKGELRLDTRAGAFEGGASGEVIVPGQPEASLLIQAVQYDGLEMPPTGKLAAAQIQVLTDWVRMGAPWPGEGAGSTPRRTAKAVGITDEDRRYWAFQPVQSPALPTLHAGTPPPATPIDAFLLARLQPHGLQTNGAATPDELVRRLFVDLTGLRPTVQEQEHWSRQIAGPTPGTFDEAACARLVDELLARPAYGEHWGRHWLDVVRFAQSNGYERDGSKPQSWRYRDYVIQAFASDTPYDRFILEQLAGDELPDASSSTRIATGFYRLGVWDDEPDDKRQAEFDELDDTMVAVGASFLGLTTGCARCHDHKFDPIPQRDYYRLLGHFRGIRPYANPEPNPENAVFVPVASDAAIREAVAGFEQRRRDFEAKLAAAPDDPAREKLKQQGFDKNLPGIEWALGVKEGPGAPPATQILLRGNAGTPGAEVQPGFLSVLEPLLGPSAADSVGQVQSEASLKDLFPSSGRRLALARQIASPQNPLTARVLVNRVWHYHFGRGIVATTADFGRAGTPPSHPELLDWLAADFMAHGWSIKHLHRQIVRSDAYRRSSRVDASLPHVQAALERDPGNVLLWRQNLRRLDAESIRDAMLAASGELNRSMGGREMFPRLSGEVLAGGSRPGLGWEVSPAEQQRRRSVYAMVKRSVRDPLVEAFDYTNTTSPLPERPITTVAPQALMLLNSRFTADRATALADLATRSSSEPDGPIDALYRAVLQRSPDERERAVARSFLAETRAAMLPLAGQLTFRPDVPASLSTEYLKQVAPEDCLLGPGEGWSYHRGLWGGSYEGIESVDRRVGPFALWNGVETTEGELRGRLRVENATEIVTLIARGEAQGDVWSGLAVTLDRRNGQAEIRHRSGTTETSTRAPLVLPHQTWVPFRLLLSGGRLAFWLGEVESAEPLVAHEVPAEAPPTGRLGVASWGGGVTLDEPRWQAVGSTLDLVRSPAPRTSTQVPPGWSRYGGDWRVHSDGTLQVGVDSGAKLLWDAQPLLDGEVRVELKMPPGRAAIGGLLLRVSEPKVGADNWYGYEVSLDLPNRRVLFGDHRHNFTLRRAQAAEISPDRWHSLRVVMTGKRLTVTLDGSDVPLIDEEVEAPLSGTLAGLRTWGSEIQFRNFSVRRGDREHRADWASPDVLPPSTPASDEAWARRQALEAFCRSLLNLNEFVYLD